MLRLVATFVGFAAFSTAFVFTSMTARLIPTCAYIRSAPVVSDANPWWVYRPGPPWICDSLGDVNLIAVLATGLTIGAVQLTGYLLVSRARRRGRLEAS